jgi:uncharacterized MAPEG superfamily protein
VSLDQDNAPSGGGVQRGRAIDLADPRHEGSWRTPDNRDPVAAGEMQMTVELTMLAYSAALLFVLVVVQALIGIRSQGLMPLANARDNLPAPTGLHARALRCVDNHREGLTIMAPLVLIAGVAHISNSNTVLGTQLFFYARVVHAALYLTGVPMIRPLSWAVGVAGTVMVFLGLMG